MYVHCRPLLIPGWVNMITVNKIPWDDFNSAKSDGLVRIMN